MIVIYVITLLLLTVFSIGFVDANFPVHPLPLVYQLIHNFRSQASIIYVLLTLLLFGFYLWVLKEIKKKTINGAAVWRIIFLSIVILFFAFPAFSYDIFNYIATAKVAFFYKENPYVVMPIEIPNDSLLAFLHASNKVALYGPAWIALTVLPHVMGIDQLIITLYSFKALVFIFYILLARLIWHTSNKNVFALGFFALNPLVILETLVSSHNDVVMMFFALASLSAAKKKRFWLGLFLLLLSVLVKLATIVLIPLYVYLWWQSHTSRKVDWITVWYWAAVFLFGAFLLSPLREELYPWYFIWPLTFLSLLPPTNFLVFVSYGFTLGLNLRFAPFVYARDWGGWVPLVKKIVSLVPPSISALFYETHKNR